MRIPQRDKLLLSLLLILLCLTLPVSALVKSQVLRSSLRFFVSALCLFVCLFYFFSLWIKCPISSHHLTYKDDSNLLYLKWITNKDLLYSTGTSARCYLAAWMGGEFGGEWIHVYVWMSPFGVHLKLSQHCLLISYTTIQNKRFFKVKKKGCIIKKNLI